MFFNHFPIKTLALALTLAATGVAGAAPVYANHSVAGDNFNYNSIFGASVRSGQAVGTSGWYYNNVGGKGSVGIDGSHPHSGNGSVAFNGVNSGSKADIEYLPGATKRDIWGNYSSVAILGPFATLTSFSYDWYRDSSSTASANLHPSLRVLIDLDGNLKTTSDQGSLVFEGSYNGVSTAPTDQWVSNTVTSSTNLWNSGLGLGNLYNVNSTPSAFDGTLAQWQAFAPNAVIIGFSSGIGSGWGSFTGAVDNISWTISGVTTTTNFEVRPAANAVPEPGSLALAALGLIGLAAARRRKQQS